jgi:hypothetical protein
MSSKFLSATGTKQTLIESVPWDAKKRTPERAPCSVPR